MINGYLNENYNDYISLFHEISLSKADFTFERKVKSAANSPFDYRLDKVDSLIKRLHPKYFKREPILNYDLLCCLLDNNVKYSDQFSHFINLISLDNEKYFEFTCGYIDTNPKNVNVFIDRLTMAKKTFWMYLNEKSGLSDSKICKLLQLTFEYASLKNILALDGQQELVDYIEVMPAFFDFASELKNDSTLKHFLSHRKVKIRNMDWRKAEHSTFFEFIYEKNAYAITSNNITSCFQYYKPETNARELNVSNLTTILNSDLTHLKDYILGNLSPYSENVLLKLPENQEAEETILLILNNKDVGDEIKNKVLDNQPTFISRIDDIEDVATKEFVIKHIRMAPTWVNIFSYYGGMESPEINDVLVTYLNNELIYSSLKHGKLNSVPEKDEAYIEAFSDQLVYCKELTHDAYTSLLQSIPYVYNDLDYTKIDKEKATWIVQAEFLTLSIENFNGLKEHYPGLHIDLIAKHEELFVTKFKEYELSDNDWALILASRLIRNDKKIALIKEFDDGLITRNAAIAKMVCQLIPSDEYIHFSFEALDAMIRSSASVDRRLALLNLHFEHIGDDQVRLLTELLGEDYARIFKLQNKPTFPNDSLHQSFIEQLKARQLISSYDFVEKTNEIKVVAKYNDA